MSQDLTPPGDIPMDDDWDDFVMVEESKDTESIPPTSDDPLHFPSMASQDKLTAICSHSVDSWLVPALMDFTIPTHCISLSDADLKAITSKSPSSPLIAKLDDAITSFMSLHGCSSVFVRLSTISPKDGTFFQYKTIQSICDALDRSPSLQYDCNEMIKLLMKHSLQNMSVCNGKDALTLLCSSARVFNDILSFLNGDGTNTCQIVLRTWTDIPLEDEFRCFIYNRKITAIGQYFHFLYFDCLTDDVMKKKKQNIIHLVNGLLAHIPQQNCILDVIVSEDKAILLEINPFGKSTGAGLFDWNKDKTLLCGEAEQEEVQIRWRREPRESFDNITLLPRDYASILQKAIDLHLANVK